MNLKTIHTIKKLVLIYLIILSNVCFSQNSTCANATPFCTGNVMNFPAATNAAAAQPGPYYGCLGSQPNHAWFFMQMNTSGPMSIVMSANWDIDFICWGPFPNMAGACSNLTQGNTQSCSYSGSNTETCTISNAIAGQFYLLLITNFSNQVQNITFSQSNANAPGAGTTNCGLVCLISGTNTGVICPGNTATLSVLPSPATSSAVTSYTWLAPGGFSTTISPIITPSLQTTITYTLRGSTASSTCQSLSTVTVAPNPVFTLTPSNPSICQGGNFFASCNFAAGSNTTAFAYSWAPNSGAGVFNPFLPNTLINPPLITPTIATVVYSIVVTPTILSCPVTRTLVLTIYNPTTPTLSMPPPLCNTFNSVLLTAVPGGGTWTTNNAISPSGLLTPNLATIGTSTVLYSVGVGTCIVNNFGSISVSQFNTPALSSNPSTLCVQDPMINLMGIVQSTLTGSWSGIGVTSNTFNPNNLATGIYNLTYTTLSTPNPSVCPSSTVLSVSVFNPPTPTINPIAALCNNSQSVTLFANPSGGVWSLNSGVSNLGVQTPSLNSIGTNSVTYTAGQFTCLASSSTTFHVSQFNTAALSGTIANLCVSNNPVNLMAIVQNTTGWWSGLNVVNSQLFNPAGLPSNTYSLTYTNPSSPNPAICPDSKTIAVSVLNPASPNISLAGPFCSISGVVQLSVSPNTGTWSSAPYLTSGGLFTPSLATVGNNQVQYVIGTNTCNSQQTKFISVEAFVPSNIVNSIPNQCNTSSAVNLLPITVNNLGVWAGPGILGASFSPNMTGAGVFVLNYNTASSPSGLCPSQSTVAVTVFSLAPPNITKIGPFCNSGSPIQILVNPLGGIFGANSPMVTSQGLFNPPIANIGDNLVNYSISVGPCIAYAQTTINIEKFVSADLEKYAGPYCKDHTPVNMNSFVKNPGGIWSGPAMVGSLFYPNTANIGNNNVLIYKTNSSPTASLCPDTSAIRVQVNAYPQVTALSGSQRGCVPMKATFNTLNTNTGSGLWNFGDGSATQQGLSATHTYTSSGSYSVSFTYADSEGCSTSTVVNNAITVLDLPKANFDYYPSEITVAEPEVLFNNLSAVLGDNNYQWLVNGISQSNELNPKITFTQVAEYKVTLKATTIDGCKDELSKTLVVKNNFNLFIPNSFTPNSDGKNDVFIPIFSNFGVDTKQYDLEIFDRWGSSIFRSTDIYKGWDGTNKNSDEPIKEGLYIYKIKYKALDGIFYNTMGHLTLLK